MASNLASHSCIRVECPSLNIMVAGVTPNLFGNKTFAR